MFEHCLNSISMQSCWTDPQRSVEAGLGGTGGATTDSHPLLGTTGSLGEHFKWGGFCNKGWWHGQPGKSKCATGTHLEMAIDTLRSPVPCSRCLGQPDLMRAFSFLFLDFWPQSIILDAVKYWQDQSLKGLQKQIDDKKKWCKPIRSFSSSLMKCLFKGLVWGTLQMPSLKHVSELWAQT